MAKIPKTKTASRPVKITEAAHKNHEELFPNHQSTLKVTDPELIEIFDNFALAESNRRLLGGEANPPDNAAGK